MRGLGRHENKKDQTIRTWVTDPVSLARWRQCYLILLQVSLLVTNLKQAFPLKNKVDLVRPLVAVYGLRLTRFEAINIAEHPVGLKEAVFLHFVLRKLKRFGNFPKFISHSFPPKKSYHRAETMQIHT